MEIAVAFGATLILAVLLSSLAHRSVMSLPLLFLVVGMLVGNGGLGFVTLGHDGDLVRHVAAVALFTVLFTDGLRVFAESREASWRPPVRALLFGMPFTALAVAGLTWALTDLPFTAALLVGVVLSPTDPVLVSAFVRRTDVPGSLRHTLNIESGVNDGLALPAVVVLIAVLEAEDAPSAGLLALELGGGVALGAAGAALIGLLARLPVLSAHEAQRPLGPVALAIALYGAAHLLHVNPFLAAFVGGATLAKLAPRLGEAFEALGDPVADLLKFFALLVFGALLEPTLLTEIPVGGYVVAVLALLLARPAGLLVSFLGTSMPRKERLAAAWFGPKGLASVLYGLWVLQSGVPWAMEMYALIALAVVLSVVVHTSTDVPVARRIGTGEVADDQVDAPPG